MAPSTDRIEKHSPIFAPSSSHAWMQCPAYNIGVVVDDTEPPPAAIEGTRAHTLFESVLNTPGFGYETNTLSDPDMVEEVRRSVAAVRELVGDGPVATERRVRFAGNPLATGTADVIARRGDTLHVIDFKYGKVNVRAEDNPQLLCYALGALNEESTPVKTVAISIVQPRSGGPLVDTWTVPAEEVERWGSETLAPAMFAREMEQDREVYGDHCTYCERKVACRAFQAAAVAPLLDDLTEAKAPSDREKIAWLVAHASAIESLLAAARKQALKLHLAGDTPPGLAMVVRKGNPQWRDDAAEALLDMFGPDALMPKSTAAVKKLPGGKDVVDALTVTGPEVRFMKASKEYVPVDPHELFG